jgi:YD repeat-containing protein
VTETSTFNEAGLVLKQEVQSQAGKHEIAYDYDDLGRLLNVVENGSTTLTNTYIDGIDLAMPGTVTSLAASGTQTVKYNMVDDFVPRVTSVVVTQAGLSAEIPFETDALGRAATYRLPGFGVVQASYDGYDRLISEVGISELGETEVPLMRTYSYNGKTTSVLDSRTLTTTNLTLDDEAGLSRSVTVTGPTFLHELGWNIKTGVEAGQSKGHLFKTEVTPHAGGVTETTYRNALGSWLGSHAGGVTETTYRTALGSWLGSESGGISMKADPLSDTNDWGFPTQFSGDLTMDLEYDQSGRLIGFTDSDGHNQSWSFDALGRTKDMRTARGGVANLEYHDSDSVLSRVTLTPPDEGSEVTLLDRQDLVSDQQNSWLGANRSNQVLKMNEKFQVGKEGQTAKLTQDPNSGLLKEVESFTGEVTKITQAMGGSMVAIQHPDGSLQGMAYDGLGQLVGMTHLPTLPFIAVARDKQHRVKQITTIDRQLTLQYNANGQVERIVGGSHPIEFKQFNAQGKPKTIEVGENGEVALIKVEYHPGGSPQCVTSTPKGGLTTRITSNDFGDIETIQRGFEPLVSYQSGSWGEPISVQLEGQPATQLFTGEDRHTLNLPGDTTATVDEEGRLSTVQRPGLTDKIFLYDAGDRLTDVVLGGSGSRHFEYTEGKGTLARIDTTSFDGASSESLSFSHDALGRLTSVERSSSSDGPFDQRRAQQFQRCFPGRELRNLRLQWPAG